MTTTTTRHSSLLTTLLITFTSFQTILAQCPLDTRYPSCYFDDKLGAIPVPAPNQDWSKLIRSNANPNYPIPDSPPAGKDGTGWGPGQAFNGIAWNDPRSLNTELSACGKGNWGFTFDDGPSGYTPELLGFLKSRNVRGTFFVIGSNIVNQQGNADNLKAAYNAGHQIGFHTWTHHHMTSLTIDEMISEIVWNAVAIYRTIGRVPRYFRPPCKPYPPLSFHPPSKTDHSLAPSPATTTDGDIDDRLRNLLLALSLRPVLWTVISDDANLNENGISPSDNYTIDAMKTRFRDVIQTGVYGGLNWPPPGGPYAGHISLEHEITKIDITAARNVIPIVLDEGKFKSVTVVECETKDWGGAYLKNGEMLLELVRSLAPGVVEPPEMSSGRTSSTSVTSVLPTNATAITSIASTSLPTSTSPPQSATTQGFNYLGLSKPLFFGAASGTLLLLIIIVSSIFFAVFLGRRKRHLKSLSKSATLDIEISPTDPTDSYLTSTQPQPEDLAILSDKTSLLTRTSTKDRLHRGEKSGTLKSFHSGSHQIDETGTDLKPSTQGDALHSTLPKSIKSAAATLTRSLTRSTSIRSAKSARSGKSGEEDGESLIPTVPAVPAEYAAGQVSTGLVGGQGYVYTPPSESPPSTPTMRHGSLTRSAGVRRQNSRGSTRSFGGMHRSAPSTPTHNRVSSWATRKNVGTVGSLPMVVMDGVEGPVVKSATGLAALSNGGVDAEVRRARDLENEREKERVADEQRGLMEKARLEREREEQVRVEREREEKARVEKDRLEMERVELERLAKEKEEKERLEKEYLERIRVERERAELERMEKERVEREKEMQRRQSVAMAAAAATSSGSRPASLVIERTLSAVGSMAGLNRQSVIKKKKRESALSTQGAGGRDSVLSNRSVSMSSPTPPPVTEAVNMDRRPLSPQQYFPMNPFEGPSAPVLQRREPEQQTDEDYNPYPADRHSFLQQQMYSQPPQPLHPFNPFYPAPPPPPPGTPPAPNHPPPNDPQQPFYAPVPPLPDLPNPWSHPDSNNPFTHYMAPPPFWPPPPPHMIHPFHPSPPPPPPPGDDNPFFMHPSAMLAHGDMPNVMDPSSPFYEAFMQGRAAAERMFGDGMMPPPPPPSTPPPMQ
ncbi:chitin deacetylase [Phlyctochytrium planicorne]|nr:chitin deacetylase [Phlyctochytrium planicorne]